MKTFTKQRVAIAPQKRKETEKKDKSDCKEANPRLLTRVLLSNII